MRVLLTGATGHIGGRLLRRLGETEHEIRCLARNPENLSGRLPGNATAVAADVLDEQAGCRAEGNRHCLLSYPLYGRQGRFCREGAAGSPEFRSGRQTLRR